MENENKETKIADLLERDGVIQTPSIDTEERKPYKLRKLSTKDLSPMIKILKKVDLKRLKNAFAEINIKEIIDLSKEKNEEGEEETEKTEKTEKNNTDLMLKVGGNIVIEAIPILLDALDNCLEDINKLLANVANMELDQLENLDLDIYFKLVYDFISKNEFMGFIKVASKFLNSEN